MVQRIFNPTRSKRSFFLFGPRGTGKSTLLRAHFPESAKILWINLLLPIEEDRFRSDSGLLSNLVKSNRPKVVVIDEIQKIPELLDEVHHLIESTKVRFILSGSSARKLKRGGANLLAGRANAFFLDALSALEMGKYFHLQGALEFGCLPFVAVGAKGKNTLDRSERINFLRSYVLTYLKEEILVEQLIRKIKPFRAFLEVAAQMNGKIIEPTKIGRDISVDEKTVSEYFSILEDTLVGFLLYPFHRSIRKKQGKKPKFYWFDPGVKRALDGTLEVPLKPSTSAYGEAFEHLVILEAIKRARQYSPDTKFSFFRTTDGQQEIDLIIERPGRPTALVEIKSSRKIVGQDAARNLTYLRSEFPKVECFVFSLDPLCRTNDGITYLDWETGINRLFSSK
jgi:uncharacterized protein